MLSGSFQAGGLSEHSASGRSMNYLVRGLGCFRNAVFPALWNVSSLRGCKTSRSKITRQRFKGYFCG